VKQQVVNGNFFAQLDLECLAALSQLSPLQPAIVEGKKVASMTTILITRF
jgi:hypothetical protein